MLVLSLAAAGIAVGLAVSTFIILQQKNRLRAFADMLEDSISTPSHGLIFFDEKQNFRLANPQARRYLPFLGEEKSDPKDLGSFLNYLYDNAVDCDESLRNALDRSAERLQGQSFREVIRWGDDKICLAEAQKTPGGRTVLILADISSIRRHEQQVLRLSDTNFELSQAVEAATSGIFITDPKKQEQPVIFVNHALCEHLGMGKEQILGKGLETIFAKFSDTSQKSAIAEAIEQSQSADQEIRIEGGGKPRWFNLKLTPVKDKAGGLAMFIGVMTETTDLKIREAEFFQAQKLEALGQLAAGVAHDFNNVLSIMDGYARLAENNMADKKTATDYLAKIRMAIGRGANLTKQMLTFSRHKIITQAVIDLADTVRDQEVLLRPLLGAGLNLTIRTEEDSYIECTADSISQILMNLAINARDAMEEGGSVLIEVRKITRSEVPQKLHKKISAEDIVCLSVTDTGVGMDPLVKDRIFDPFFTTKEPGKGTGLGLSMVYGLVQQNGGAIDVVSSPGRGATFSVYLPLSDKKPQKVVTGSLKDIESINLKGYTALIAEDEPDLLLLVGGMLEKLGMNVLRASDGNDALLKQDDYDGDIDLLLTDVVMPEMNGIKLSELLGSLRPDAKTIFMSGYPAGGQMAVKMDLPDEAVFMAKPVKYETLAQLIYETLVDGGKHEDLVQSRWESSNVDLGRAAGN